MRQRSRLRARAAGLLVVGAVLFLSASDVVADRWSRVSRDVPLSGIDSIDRGLRYRVRWHDADVHVVMWFVGGLAVLLWWCRTVWQRLLAVCALFGLTVAIEWYQGRYTTTRTPSWLDVVGGGVGLAFAFVVAEIVAWGRARRARRRTADRDDAGRGSVAGARWYVLRMRATWPILAATIAAGIGLGTWIAGIPSSDGSMSVAEGATPTSPPAITVTPTNANAEITASTAPTTSTVPSTSAVPTTLAPETTTPTTVSTTEATTTTTTPTTTTTIPTTTAPATTAPVTTTPQLLERGDVRLVVGNGDGRFNLVGVNVARLEPLGYTQIDQTDLAPIYDRTILYIRPGFDDEAVRLAADLLVPSALIEPLPATPVSINDELGDIIVVLGPDAVR